MPAVYKLQFNSEYAFGVNDGAFIPNRGFQNIISAGAYVDMAMELAASKPGL